MRRTEQEYSKDEVARALKVVGWIKDYEIDLHPDLPPRSIIVKLFETTKLDDVWREVGVVVPGKRRRYTKEEVAEALKKVGWLTVKEINRHPDLPTDTTIFKLFKTTKINDVWQELNIPFAPRPSYTKEVVAEALKETGWIKNEDIQSRPELPSLTAIINLFNTTKMSDVWRQLNISPQPQSRSKYTKEEVTKALKRIGWLPKEKIEQHPDLPSAPTIRSLFNTTKMTDVWKELNITIPPLSMYTKDEVAKALKKIGYLTASEIHKHPDLPSLATITRLFKTTNMSDVWKQLNISSPQSQFNYTKESVSKVLKETGYLTTREIEQHPDLPSYKTIVRLFKTTTMNDVWKELGIPFTQLYTKDEVAKKLKEIGWLKEKEVNKHPELPASTTIRKLFKTTNINEVWKQLGIDIPPRCLRKPKVRRTEAPDNNRLFKLRRN